jgi:condensin complex subunit 2
MVRILEEMRLNVVSKETNFTGRRSKKTSKLIDDDDEHTLCDPGINKKGLCHNFEDEEDVREESNDQTHPPSSTKIRNSFISNRDEKLSMSQLRKRRRSSARFLRMSGRFTLDHEDGDTVESDKTEEKNEHLGEMYRQVIRMNAENKINASNSWGLKLIENIDKFLEDDVTTGTQTIENSTAIETSGSDGANHEASDLANLRENDKRINFTKASCTIDASVKIYSYRVDDVYLSSYKVLANLNRSDGNHTTETDIDNMGHDQESSQSISDEKLIGSAYSSEKKVKQNQVICTLEENLCKPIYSFSHTKTNS